MIDNYDSFTFNLVHYFEELGQTIVVKRNDEITISEISQLNPDYLVISPGPCDPNSAGISLSVVEHFKGRIPLLGVCLGHQTIAQHFGAQVVKANQVMHGKTSLINHNGQGLFKGLAQPLEVTRYHSLIVNKSTLPPELNVTAWTEDAHGEVNEIMAIEHNTLPIMGVQFHPLYVLRTQNRRANAHIVIGFQCRPGRS